MNERETIISIAKMFDGNKSVNWETTTNLNLLLLIRDSVEYVLDEGRE
tara:strand:+ start:4158 stop:4301 length:144 start_codon:yes stop_codon:yes gene_type:complete